MRIRHFFSSLVAIGLVAAALSSCASDDATVQPVPIPETSSQAVQTPFQYYRSPERMAIFQSALTEVGNDWMGRMLTGEIPSVKLGWANNSAAPLNGYGILASAPDPVEGELYVQVSVNFVNGEIDLDTPIGLYAQTTTGHILALAGEGPVVASDGDSTGIKVSGSPYAYSWYYGPGLDEGDIPSMKLVNADGTDLPYDQSLAPGEDYRVVVGADMHNASVDEITRLDDMFFRELRSVL